MMLIDSHGVAEVNSLEQFSGRGSCKVASVGGPGGGAQHSNCQLESTALPKHLQC